MYYYVGWKGLATRAANKGKKDFRKVKFTAFMLAKNTSKYSANSRKKTQRSTG